MALPGVSNAAGSVPRGANLLTRYDRLLGIADHLGKTATGSLLADEAIHEAVGRLGPVQPYTTSEASARTLLPPGFEWVAITPSAGWIYAPCRRAGIDAKGLPYPHHGQWAQTIPLSLCAGVLRTWAMLVRQEEGARP